MSRSAGTCRPATRRQRYRSPCAPLHHAAGHATGERGARGQGGDHPHAGRQHIRLGEASVGCRPTRRPLGNLVFARASHRRRAIGAHRDHPGIVARHRHRLGPWPVVASGGNHHQCQPARRASPPGSAGRPSTGSPQGRTARGSAPGCYSDPGCGRSSRSRRSYRRRSRCRRRRSRGATTRLASGATPRQSSRSRESRGSVPAIVPAICVPWP